MSYSAEFKEMAKAMSGSIVQINSLDKSSKIDLFPYFLQTLLCVNGSALLVEHITTKILTQPETSLKRD